MRTLIVCFLAALYIQAIALPGEKVHKDLPIWDNSMNIAGLIGFPVFVYGD
jgi:hypothetical protein